MLPEESRMKRIFVGSDVVVGDGTEFGAICVGAALCGDVGGLTFPGVLNWPQPQIATVRVIRKVKGKANVL